MSPPIFDMDAVNNAPDEGMGARPGVYRVKVGAVDTADASTGRKMWTLDLVDFHTGKRICFDRFMLDGKPFALTLTKGKLKTLGVGTGGPVDPERDVKGRAAWVATILGPPNDKGRRYLQVDIEAEGSKFGYFKDGPECPVNVDESQASSVFELKADPKPGDPDFVPF